MNSRLPLRFRSVLTRLYLRRWLSSAPKPHPTTTTTPPPPTSAHARLSRLTSRLPPRLARLTAPLLAAPLSHTTSFLLLHELTAVAPLLGLFALFHWAGWVPAAVAEGEWARAGAERFASYFRRKGWIADEDAPDAGQTGTGVRVVVEAAAAWAITKALLPLRLALSVWLTPWGARVVVGPVGRAVGRLFGRR